MGIILEAVESSKNNILSYKHIKCPVAIANEMSNLTGMGYE